MQCPIIASIPLDGLLQTECGAHVAETFLSGVRLQ